METMCSMCDRDATADAPVTGAPLCDVCSDWLFGNGTHPYTAQDQDQEGK